MNDSPTPDDIKYMQTVRDGNSGYVDSHPADSKPSTSSQRDVTDDETSSDDDGRPILTPLPIYDKPLKKNEKPQSFCQVLDEILSEDTKCPEISKIGPKPWLHRRSVPKPKVKYLVSQEPFIYKGKKGPQPTQPEQTPPNPKPTTPISSNNATAARPDKNDSSTPSSRPPSRGKELIAANDGQLSVKNPTDADTEVAYHTSTPAKPSLLPSSDEVGMVESARNAHELATAALRALSLTKDIVDNERKRATPQGGSRVSSKDQEDSLYDKPRSYELTEDDENKKVISVPIFKPPPDPVRNDKDHPMLSEPVYDVSRSSIPTPANVSQGALDLMYQLFGKDLTGNNPLHAQYNRPGSAKSVSFGNEIPGGEPRGQRAPSRAGSVCSEWSDCTINIPDYPESEATTLPAATIDFPEIPQVGFEPHPMRPPDPNHYPLHTFANPHFQQNFANPRPYFPTPTYDTPRRYPVPFTPQRMPPPIPNDSGYANFDPEVGTRYNPYHPNRDMGPWSPPHPPPPQRTPWGAFSPTGPYDPNQQPPFRPPMHHPKRPHPRTMSRSPPTCKNRHESHSEDETYFSRSPSPIHRRRHRQDYDVIGKSYIDGYKAAMKDAVKTFTESQLKPNLTEKESEEEKLHRTLRRALTSGRIDAVPDNVELGDIRKAFTKKYSDDDDDMLDDVTIENFLVPDSGRPLSRKNSVRRRHRDDDVIDDATYEEVHCDSCDCSGCEEEMEKRNSFHDGELRKRRETRRNYAEEVKKGDGKDCRMDRVRERYLESLETSSRGRKPYGMNMPPPHHRPQGRENFEDVRHFHGESRNGFHLQSRHSTFLPTNQRGQLDRHKRIQSGY